MALGGPAFGFFACQKKAVRNMPGRLVGETVDGENRRGFVLTLATREQHIRREKATSNICTSQTLCTLAATVFMSLLGKSGMRRLAELNVARAYEACERLSVGTQLKRCFSGPFFNEFVFRAESVDRLFERCSAQKIVPGVALTPWYPELEDAFLMCVTDMIEREEIDRVVRVIAGS
jgi:glycine dehydrogenase subunit 1